MIQSFYDHIDKVKEAYPSLKVRQLLNFKNDVDDIVAFELDELVYYIGKVYSLRKDKYTISMQ